MPLHPPVGHSGGKLQMAGPVSSSRPDVTAHRNRQRRTSISASTRQQQPRSAILQNPHHDRDLRRPTHRRRRLAGDHHLDDSGGLRGRPRENHDRHLRSITLVIGTSSMGSAYPIVTVANELTCVAESSLRSYASMRHRPRFPRVISRDLTQFRVIGRNGGDGCQRLLVGDAILDPWFERPVSRLAQEAPVPG
jgi:hypothetical protein